MDLALVTAGLAFVGLSSYVVRRLRGCRVNCWFCNTDQVVPWSSKNAFVCTGCDQYNGFNEDGDYNKQILGQHFASSRTQKMRFCNSGLLSDRPDVVPSRFENGLCEECNQKQEIIVERLSQFEPKNESHWQAEVDDYKNRLNKIYALCEPCLMASQRKLRRDKSLYGYLMHLTSFGRKLASTIVNGNNSSPNKKTKKSRKCFFAGGRVTEINHFVVFIIATLLALAEVNFLQQISNGMPSIDGFLSSFLGNATAPLLGFVHDSFYGAIILLFASNSIAMLSNKCRISFPDLLVFGLSLMLFIIAHDVFPKSFQKDLVLFRCGFSSLLFCLSTAVWILPRKLKHKKRPNTIASAFSIASTPMSQCSTSPISPQNEHNQMDWEHSYVGRTPSHLIRRQGQSSPPRLGEFSRQNEHNQMEWEHGDVGRTPSHLVRRQQQSSPPRIGGIERKSRESISSRDFGGLKLGKGDSSSPHHGSFSSLYFHPGVRNANSVASEKSFQTTYQSKSHYTGFTPVSQRSPNPLAMPPSLRSRFTNDSASVSTRLTDPHPQYQPQPTQKLLVGLVVLCFLSNILPIYYLWVKPWI